MSADLVDSAAELWYNYGKLGKSGFLAKTPFSPPPKGAKIVGSTPRLASERGDPAQGILRTSGKETVEVDYGKTGNQGPPRDRIPL